MKAKIVGAGLVGSLLSIFLKKRGMQVEVFEKRKDPRTQQQTEGRSINLVLASRGLAALDKLGLKEEMLSITVPLYGRMIHDLHGQTTFQPYGKAGEAIYSVSRKVLNEKLLDAAEQEQVLFHFENELTSTDAHDELLIGADGLGSMIRKQMAAERHIEEKITSLEHGYKELTIPPKKEGGWAMEKNALHIWPREQFMLIALPNQDGSFTCTLFLQMEGAVSFATMTEYSDFEKFINNQFPDAFELLTSLERDFYENPVSRLLYLQCWPWVAENKFIIGDAAHAVVPFYGQGMNAGFEDCAVLDQLMETHDITTALQKYQESRKPNADAICALSLQNFIEMRDKVADGHFQKGKKLSAVLAQLFPDQWIPQYSQVTFTTIPYTEALQQGQEQQALLEKLLAMEGYHDDWINDQQLRSTIEKEVYNFFQETN